MDTVVGKTTWTIYVILRWFRYKRLCHRVSAAHRNQSSKHGSQITGIYGMIQNSTLWMWLIEYPFWVNSKCSALGMKRPYPCLWDTEKRKQGNFLVQWRKESWKETVYSTGQGRSLGVRGAGTQKEWAVYRVDLPLSEEFLLALLEQFLCLNFSLSQWNNSLNN